MTIRTRIWPCGYDDGPAVGVQAMLILAGILIFLYCGNSLTPAINAARDEGPAGAERFDRLHKRSVRLNAVANKGSVTYTVAIAADNRDGKLLPSMTARVSIAVAERP